ncbi:MAG: apolipoprotein N-acyltransferase [Rickettsiales bacterium]|nr:apolipoprotein N-acyltransferase [Rickettsiales bacterium]
MARNARRIPKFFFNRVFLIAWAVYFAADIWMVQPFRVISPEHYCIGYLLLALISGIAALYAGAAWGVALLYPKAKRWFVFPAAFTIFDLIRVVCFYELTFPIPVLSFVWAGAPLISQSIALLGREGLTFLTLLFAGAILARRWNIVCAIAAGVISWGGYRLAQPEGRTALNTRIAIISGENTSLEFENNFAKTLELLQAQGAEKIDLFILPETAIKADLRYSSPYLDRLAAAVPDRADLITGFEKLEYGAAGAYRLNSLAHIKNGRIAAQYDKRMLSPYGEYIPKWLPFGGFITEAKEFAPGLGSKPILRVGQLAASPYICYEVIFDSVHETDADFIANISSDGWFPPFGKLVHFIGVKYAAIAEGIPIVRAANRGISAVVSPYGRVIARLDGFGVLDSYIPARIGRTLFSYTGNLLILAICAALLWPWHKPPRARGKRLPESRKGAPQ